MRRTARRERAWRRLGCAALLASGIAHPPAHAQATDPALRGHGGPVRALAILGDGATLATGGFDSAIIVWDLNAGSAQRVLRFHDSTVNALASLADGCLISAGEDARIARWCGAGAAPVAVLQGHVGPIAALAVSPGGRHLASAAWDRQVRLWPLDVPGVPGANAASTPSRVLAEHKAPVNGVAFLPGGQRVVSASYDGEVRLTPLDPAATSLQLQLPAPVNGLAVTPDGRIALTSADGRLRVLDQRLGPLFEIELPDGPLTAIAIAPDGRLAAVAGLRTPVTLIDLERRAVMAKILGPGLPIWTLAFARDGRELLTGGADRAVRRFDVATGLPLGSAIAGPGDTLGSTAREPGALVFRACEACHSLRPEDGHRAGPTLHGVIGRRIASAPGYAFSDALKKLDIVWTAETIARLFEIGPNAMTPGTKMPEQRVTDPAERHALIEWIAKASKP